MHTLTIRPPKHPSMPPPTLALDPSEYSLPADERRTCDRYSASLPIDVQPVDRQLAADGEPFAAVSSDISQTGICFFNSRPLHTNFAVIALTTAQNERLTLLGQIVRCRRVGSLYEIAANFVRKV